MSNPMYPLNPSKVGMQVLAVLATAKVFPPADYDLTDEDIGLAVKDPSRGGQTVYIADILAELELAEYAESDYDAWHGRVTWSITPRGFRVALGVLA